MSGAAARAERGLGVLRLVAAAAAQAGFHRLGTGQIDMAKRSKAPLWRSPFLRALARTGNVRVSACEAGVDPGTAYDHRIKDGGFAAKWRAAEAAGFSTTALYNRRKSRPDFAAKWAAI